MDKRQIDNENKSFSHHHSQTVFTERGTVARTFDSLSFSFGEALIGATINEVMALSKVNTVPSVSFMICQTIGDKITMMRPYVKGTTLSDKIITEGPSNRCKNLGYAISIAKTLVALHKNGITANNIKANNVIIDTNDEAVLVDFGIGAIFADTLNGDNQIMSFIIQGPEGTTNTNKPPTTARDMFQFGLLLFVMFVGSLPWTVPNLPRMMKQMNSGEIPIPNYLDDDVKTLLSSLFNPNPQMRPTAEETLKALEEMSQFCAKPVHHLSKNVNQCKSFKSLGAVLAMPKAQSGIIGQRSSMSSLPLRKRTSDSLTRIDSFRDITPPTFVLQ